MGRVFTQEEARSMMPQVRALTRPAFELASSLAEELRTMEQAKDETRAEELRERLQTLAESWSKAIRELGPDVSGLWLVDFDSGDGYWRWGYPDTDLSPWHSHADGFTGRVEIS